MVNSTVFMPSDLTQRITLRDKVASFLSRKLDESIITKAYSMVPVERSQNFNLKPHTRPNDELMLRAFGDNPWMRVKFQKLCSAIASLDIDLFERLDNGGMVPLSDNYPMYDIIRRPNPLMHGWDFRFLSELYVRVAGACFWRPIFDGFGVPRQMWLYPAHWVIIIRNPRTWEIVYYDVRQPNGYIERLGPHELLWIRTPDPLNPYFKGLGEALALATEIDTFELASESDRRFFENDATPKGALIVPGAPNSDEVTRIKDDWKRKMGAPDNYGETAVLSGGMDYKTFRSGRREMDFIEGQKYLRDVILSGVHPHIVGIAENVNRANAEAAEYSFSRWEISPRVEWWENVWNTSVAPYFHESIIVKIEDPVPANAEYELNKASKGLQIGGITRNEYRKAMGYELTSPEEGDVYLVPVNVQLEPAEAKTESSELPPSGLSDPSEAGGRPGDVVDPSAAQPYRRPGQEAPPNTGGGTGGSGGGGGQGGTPGGTPEISPVSPTGPAGTQTPVFAGTTRIIGKNVEVYRWFTGDTAKQILREKGPVFIDSDDAPWTTDEGMAKALAGEKGVVVKALVPLANVKSGSLEHFEVFITTPEPILVEVKSRKVH